MEHVPTAAHSSPCFMPCGGGRGGRSKPAVAILSLPSHQRPGLTPGWSPGLAQEGSRWPWQQWRRGAGAGRGSLCAGGAEAGAGRGSLCAGGVNTEAGRCCRGSRPRRVGCGCPQPGAACRPSREPWSAPVSSTILVPPRAHRGHCASQEQLSRHLLQSSRRPFPTRVATRGTEWPLPHTGHLAHYQPSSGVGGLRAAHA